jgi:hypothetical protein
LYGSQRAFAGGFVYQPQAPILRSMSCSLLGVGVMHGGYRGVVRLAPFLSVVTPARRKASASAPLDAGSFRRGSGVRGVIGASGRGADAAGIATVPDHRKRLLGDRLVRGDIIRCVEKPLVDLGTGHETIDLDHVGALDLDGVKLLVLDDQVLTLGDLVAAALVLGGDRLAGLLVDELLAQPIAGGLWRKATRSEVEQAACSAIGHETSASLR